MKRLLLLLLTLYFGVCGAEWMSLNRAQRSLFTVRNDTPDTITLDFSLDGIDITQTDVGETTYQKISYQNEGVLLTEGAPDLPCFSRLIQLPDQGEVSVTYQNLSSRAIEHIRPYPRQPLQSESTIEHFPFTCDAALYEQDALFPGTMVEIAPPVIMRGVRVARLTVYPLQWQAAAEQLQITDQMQITLHITGNGGVNQPTRQPALSRQYRELMQASVLNYHDQRELNPHPGYLIVHPADDQVAQVLHVLADWKRQKGFDVTMESLEHIGTSNTELKAYIQNIYNTWPNPPEFIVLAGDADGTYVVPTAFMDGGEGDHFYTLLEGNDILADACIGRLSYSSTFELQTIVSKIVSYERNPYMGTTDWYDRALLVGDPSASGTSTVDTKRSVKLMIDQHQSSMNSTEVYSGPFATQIQNNINDGCSFFNYRGFGGMSGYTNSNISVLSNGFKLPIAVIITCNTGSFVGSTSRTEEFIRTGTPGAPNGAVAAIGTSTGSTHTCFNNCVDAGISYGIFVDKISHIGGALNRGKLALYLSYPTNPSNHVYQFSYWNNLMGDPSLEIRNARPMPLNVQFDALQPQGTNTMTVVVEDQFGAPVPDAWVTLASEDGAVFSSVYSDASGMAVLQTAGNNSGSASLVVSKQNFIPLAEDITFAQQTSYAALQSVSIDDDLTGTSSGNNNGQINPGETIEIPITVENFGTTTLSDLTAQISCSMSGVTVLDGEESFPAVAAGASAGCLDDFDLQIGHDFPVGEPLVLDLMLSAGGDQWPQQLVLDVYSPCLTPLEYHVVDGNGLIDPGDSVAVWIDLENVGGASLDDFSCLLTSNDERIVLSDSVASFSAVATNAIINNQMDPFWLVARTNVFPGMQFTLQLQFSTAAGFVQDATLPITIGDASSSDPLGPDSFGYVCYDDTDLNYLSVPTYDWIEIDPDLGGVGEIQPLVDYGDTGDTISVALPFDFAYYGQHYDRLTICSNGWVSPGTGYNTSFMNWSIPGPGGPSPIIAVFWDDLKTNYGNVCTYYDASGGYYVVEWSGLRNAYSNSTETFQVIIYDRAVHPVSNNQNMFKMQYKEIHNDNVGQYGGGGVNHGAYCTVGLEDHTGTLGLQYTFNDKYPVQAPPLENNRALLFSSAPVLLVEPHLTLGSVLLDDSAGNGNGMADFGESILLQIAVNNMGMLAAHNVQGVLSSTDPHITIDQANIDFGVVAGNGQTISADLAAFTVHPDCPDLHMVNCVLTLQSDEGSWELPYPITLHAPVVSVEGMIIADGDNNSLDPGDTAQLYLMFNNSGTAGVGQVNTEVQCTSSNITFSTNSAQTAMMQAGMISTTIFTLDVSTAAQVGDQYLCTWQLEGSGPYEVSGEFYLAIGLAPLNLVEDFTGMFPPQGWTVAGGTNWGISYTNQANGSSPEARFGWIPVSTGIQRLISPPQNTLGSNSLLLQFNHRIQDYQGAGYEVSLETTSDGVNWQLVEIWPPIDYGPAAEYIMISNSDVGSETFQFAFTFEGESDCIGYWFVDDVSLTNAGVQLASFIDGTVELLGGSGTVEDCTISAGSFSISPEPDGSYMMPVMPGTFDLSVQLDGYKTMIIPDITLELGQSVTLPVQLFVENDLNTPTDFTLMQNENSVVLSWIPPATGTNTLLGYRLYRNSTLLSEMDDPLIVSAEDTNLDEGFYYYYLTAVFDAGESVPTACFAVDVVLPIPLNLTYTMQGDDVHLFWIAPNTSITVTEYKIYRDDEYLASSTSMTYLDDSAEPGSHSYYVTALYDAYESQPSNSILVLITDATSPGLPVVTRLIGNHPNPFNPETSISFALDADKPVQLDVFNVRGQRVVRLLDDTLAQGLHSVIWNGVDAEGKPVASGLYFYRLQAGDYRKTQKMMLLK